MKNQPMQTPYILWADDDTDDLMFIRESFELLARNYRMMEASNGQQVLDFLDTINDPVLFPSLIVLDMNMPVLNGGDTLTILKREEKYASIPVVIFTTSSREKDKSFCKVHGVEMFSKPDSFNGYCSTIEKILSHFSGTLKKEWLLSK